MAGHDRSVSHPSDSLARPILPPGVHVYTDHEAAWHRLPADLGLKRSLLVAHVLPPLPPKQWVDEPTKAPAADGAEDQACPERSHTRKSRPSVGPVSRPPSCFTVFQTRTLGWVWGFFPAYFTDRRLEGEELETGRVLPFRRRLRHGGAGVDAGRRAGLPLTPPAKPWPSVPHCWPAETTWVRRQRLLSQSDCAGCVLGAGTVCDLPGWSITPARGAESQGETRRSYRPSPRRQGLAEPRGGGGGRRPAQQWQSGVNCKKHPREPFCGSFSNSTSLCLHLLLRRPGLVPGPTSGTCGGPRRGPSGAGALPRGHRLRAGAGMPHSPVEETVSRAAPEKA